MVTHFQSIARPFGQPRVVFTMDTACDPSPHALIIFAGLYQSVQKIYLSGKKPKTLIPYFIQKLYDKHIFMKKKLDVLDIIRITEFFLL